MSEETSPYSQPSLFGSSTPESSSLRTCPDSSVPETTPSAVCLENLWALVNLSSRQGSDGQTRVLCLDPKRASLGESLTLNMSAWPNDASVSSLRDALETGPIHSRFYLSQKACSGILRRADRRGRALPPLLRQALERVAQTTTKPKEDA